MRAKVKNIGKNSKSVKNKTGKEISDEYLEIIDYIIDANFSKVFHTHSAVGYELHPEIEEYAGDRIRAIGYKNRGLNDAKFFFNRMGKKKLHKRKIKINLFKDKLVKYLLK